MNPSRFQVLGRYLKSLRKQEQRSLQEIGDRVGLRGGYLSKIERGIITNPTVGTLALVATAYRTNPKRIFGFLFSDEVPPSPTLEAQAKQLAEHTVQLTTLSEQVAALSREITGLGHKVERILPDSLSPTAPRHLPADGRPPPGQTSRLEVRGATVRPPEDPDDP